MTTKIRNDQIDTGTGANQIVKLDGSARLPAVDGSLLTNVGGTFTEDASLNIVGGTGSGGAITATAYRNFIAGYFAGQQLNTGDDNVFIGRYAGNAFTNGGNNICIGQYSMLINQTGAHNIALGYQSGDSVSGGGGNVLIGRSSGANLVAGSNNVCIGNNAGPTANTASQLFINAAVSASDTPLIWGNFTSPHVTINGDFDVTGAIVNTNTAFGGHVSFGEGSANGSSVVKLKAADALANSSNYVLPEAAPTGAHQYLTATAGGSPATEQTMSWSNPIELLYDTPTLVGSELNITGSFPSIESLNSTDVVHVNFELDTLQLYRWDGSTWTATGTGYDLTTIIPLQHSMARLNDTDFALANFSDAVLQTYRFNGSAIVPFGGSFSLAGVVTGLSVCQLTSVDIAYFDQTRATLRTYTFGGSPGWTQTGNALAVTSATVAMARLNDTDIAYVDSTTEILRTYTFNGTDWSQVGNGLDLINVTSPSLAALAIPGSTNCTDVILANGLDDSLTAYRWDGTNWNAISESTIVTGMGTPTITGLTSSDIAFFDATNDDLRTYRFGEIIGTVEATDWLDNRFAPKHLTINNQIGTTYTLALIDDGALVTMGAGSPNTLTVPPNSSVAFPIGTQILVQREGSGLTTIAAGSGVTLHAPSGLLSLAAQYSSATVVKKDTDTWLVSGDLA